MAGRVPWNALAIVVAGAFIGLGLFFGLKKEAPPLPAASAPADPTQDAKAVAARAALAAWLEAQRPIFVSRCWAPSAARDPNPPRASFTYSLAVDENGKEVGRGITEHRDAFRSDVADCLRTQANAPASIPPPGASVSVQLTITLPN